jgi:uncharacterized membrane protein
MKPELTELTARVWQVLQINKDWMTWNLFLAFIPLALSVWLFRKRQEYPLLWWLGCLMFFAFLPNAPYVLYKVKDFTGNLRLTQAMWLMTLAIVTVGVGLLSTRRGRAFWWWLGFLGFYAFLPNAPYLLTDVIHLIYDIRTIQSVWIITLILIPLYLVVILAGFEAYVLSLINLGYHLHRVGKSQWILAVELITHALSAVGIYLGRFLRFNSWDLITKPDALLTQTVEELLGKQPLVIMAVTFLVIAGLYWLMKQVTLAIILRSRKNFATPRTQANSPTTES